MASGGEEGGFRFSFGEPAENDKEEVAPAVEPWPTPRTPLSSFPWITVNETVLADWLAQYPGPQTAAGKPSRQQRLTFPQSVPSFAGAAVCYQTAPTLSQLTTINNETSVGESRDIIPGKYYGGLKVWSCAPDLALYLVTHAAEWVPRLAGNGPRVRPPVVAEVGCGQAVPGLAAILLGARKVILQDYNAEVLDVCVKPNLAATVQFAGNDLFPAPSSCSPPLQVKLVHGDWVDLECDDAADGTDLDSYCDVVLGADVTFDTEACSKLATLLSRWLRPGDGVALIATKVFYFGTNGGTLEFSQCATACGLQVTELTRVEDDSGMKRTILAVTRPLS